MSETRETQPLLQSQNQRKTRIIGSILAVLSAFTFALTNFLVKRWHLDFVDVLFSRATLQIIIFGPLLYFTKSRIENDENGHSTSCHQGLYLIALLLFQGLLSGITVVSVVLAVNNLPLGDAITIIYSGPVFTMILSTICFKTRLGLFKVFLACLLVSGIVLVAKPSSIFPDDNSENCTLGIIAGLVCALAGALIAVITGYLKSSNTYLLVFYAGIGGLLTVFLAFHFDEKSLIFHQLNFAPFPELLLIGTMGLIAYFMALKSYQMIHPTIGCILKSNEVIFAFILQSTLPSGFTILGAFFVILSGVLVPLETQIVQCIQIDWLRKIL